MLIIAILALDFCDYPFSLHAVISPVWMPSAHASNKASLEAPHIFHIVYPSVMQKAHTTLPALAIAENVEKIECMTFYGQPPREID